MSLEQKVAGGGDKWSEWLEIRLRGRLGPDLSQAEELDQVQQVVGD